MISPGQTYLAVSCWVPIDPRPGVENGSSYVLRWTDDVTGGQDGGFDPFQVLPTASADISYAKWPAGPTETADSLDGVSHILALACPGSASKTGYVSIYKYSVLVRNVLTGTIAHLCNQSKKLTSTLSWIFKGGPGFFLHLETLPFLRPTGVLTFSIPAIGNFLAGTYSTLVAVFSIYYHKCRVKKNARISRYLSRCILFSTRKTPCTKRHQIFSLVMGLLKLVRVVST